MIKDADNIQRVKPPRINLSQTLFQVIGPPAVGKTTLIRRLVKGDGFISVENDQQKALTTLGVDFSIYDMEVEGMPIKCQLWDIAGEEASIFEFST